MKSILTVKCPKCATTLQVKTRSAEKVVACPKCRTPMTVSAAASPGARANAPAQGCRQNERPTPPMTGSSALPVAEPLLAAQGNGWRPVMLAVSLIVVVAALAVGGFFVIRAFNGGAEKPLIAAGPGGPPDGTQGPQPVTPDSQPVTPNGQPVAPNGQPVTPSSQKDGPSKPSPTKGILPLIPPNVGPQQNNAKPKPPGPPPGQEANSCPALKEIIARLPSDRLPKSGDDIFRTQEVQKFFKAWWLENGDGKTVDVACVIKRVDIEARGQDEYNLFVHFGPRRGDAGIASRIKAQTIDLGPAKCHLNILVPGGTWRYLDAETAKKVRDLKDKRIVLRGYLGQAGLTVKEGELDLTVPLLDIAILDPPIVLTPTGGKSRGLAQKKNQPATPGNIGKGVSPFQGKPRPKPILASEVPPRPEIPGAEVRRKFLAEDGFFPKMRSVATFVNGEPHGEIRGYGPRRRLVAVERVERGRLNGERQTFYPSGKQLGSLTFVNDRPHGPDITWYENGHVAFITHWKDGVMHGPTASYFVNGFPMIEFEMVNGRAHGERRHFYPDGSVYALTQWNNGQQVGQKQFRPDTSELLARIQERSRFSQLTKDHWTAEILDRAPAPPGLKRLVGQWVALFNGKDLDGWWPNSDPKAITKWEVHGGILTGSGDGKHMGWLISEDGDYRNFHLRVEARINATGNSGVYIGVPRMRNFDFALGLGFEAQICAGIFKSKAQGAPKKPTHTGAIVFRSNYTGPGSTNQLHHAPDQWFTMDLIVQGNKIVSKVNGTTTAEESPVPNRDPKLEPGHIALQKHFDGTTIVQFRKIDVMLLDK